MSRKEKLKIVNELIDDEHMSAINKYGYFTTEHEAVSVLLEEIQELDEEISIVKKDYDRVWKLIREGGKQDSIYSILSCIRLSAIYAIEEAIQVAAMCDKYRRLLVQMQLTSTNTRKKERRKSGNED